MLGNIKNLFKSVTQSRQVEIAKPPMAKSGLPKLGIQQFSYFSGFVVLKGWTYNDGLKLQRLTFKVSTQEFDVPQHALESPNAPDGHCGFSLSIDTRIDAFTFAEPSLLLEYEDGTSHLFEALGVNEILEDRGHRLFPEFMCKISTLPSGRLLEIGSRARSGISRRIENPGWEYVGMDIMDGPNVDVVGDAHQLSKLLPANHFDAAMSLSVFEHLAMPWKVAIELNKVLKLGGIAFLQTHQAFPLHDEPWDFWRISSHAWSALFNEKTGFRIVEAAMAEPVMFVAKRWHPGMNLHESRGCGVSSVLVEKIGESKVQWDVELADVLVSHYPE